jgi:KUP system potassium uptake protein
MAENGRPKHLVALTALGIVYGDIGTSPLYALRIAADTGADPIGIASLALWTLTVCITVKYILVVLRADNSGEGGILALAALALRHGGRNCPRPLVIAIGLTGAALLAADAVITPAISVLAAVEGLKEVDPWFTRWVMPIAIVILLGLFAIQPRGTERIGRAFGPVMLTWFTALGLLGLASVLQTPEVLAAFDPRRGAAVLLADPGRAALLIGAVFLTVTGGEALYADMGHVGRPAIVRAWLVVVMPGLALNYLGQAALVLREPDAAANPFYGLVPTWLLIPTILLATAATVIAAQAVISGLFSLARQMIALGWWPRLEVRHTSHSGYGQIYVPAVSFALCAGALALVVGFGHSDDLAAAYGLSVSGTMLATTLLLAVVMRRHWGWRPWLVVPVVAPLLAIDIVFVRANLEKFADGGWVPSAIALALLAIATIWRSGSRALIGAIKAEAVTAQSRRLTTVCGVEPVRVPGTAVFLTRSTVGVPPVMVRQAHTTGALHENVVLLTVETLPIPRVPARDRIMVGDTDGEDNLLQPAEDSENPGFWRVRVRYGYMQSPNLAIAMRELAALGLPLEPESVVYFIGHATVVPREGSPLPARLRTRLFAWLGRNSADPSDLFHLPRERTAEIGFRIAV